MIHDKDLLGNSVEVIDEFPFFSFLLGDMHPHVLALPFVLLAIGVGLNLMLFARSMTEDEASSPSAVGVIRKRVVVRLWHFLRSLTGVGPGGLLLCAVILGALAFLNTWDFPIYVALVTLAVGAGLALREGLSWVVVGRAAAAGATLGVLGVLCYLPFYLGFQSQLGGILPNLLFPSRLSQFLLVFGVFLMVVVFYLGLLSRPRADSGDSDRKAGVAQQITLHREPNAIAALLHDAAWGCRPPPGILGRPWASCGLTARRAEFCPISLQ